MAGNTAVAARKHDEHCCFAPEGVPSDSCDARELVSHAGFMEKLQNGDLCTGPVCAGQFMVIAAVVGRWRSRCS